MSHPPTRVVLMRHGETRWNVSGRLQGTHDSELTPGAITALGSLAASVSVFEHIVTSPLGRAVASAGILGVTGRVVIDERWREMDLGDWAGRPMADLSPDLVASWRRGEYNPPGGEPFADVVHRVTAAADELRGVDDNVLVITHGGTIRALLQGLLGIPPRVLAPCPPAAFCVLELADADRLVSYAVGQLPALVNHRSSSQVADVL